ncbi:MAG: FAD-binding oxidoreductase, partial [Candidatus Pacebacteria bacterium]|nr:FAD-binding oxidoreductase [Candidatus Paceibacterota bacterium]
MKITKSPWLHQLNDERKTVKLSHDIETDITIVGAGIAGISTAFYILKNTDARVAIIEKGKLASGATGHNAGQVVSYFERSFADMVREYGMEKTAHAWKSVENAWTQLDEMYTTAKLDIPFSRFIGHDGFISLDQVLHYLEDNRLRREAGMKIENIRVATEAGLVIPEKYKSLYDLRPQKEILQILETENTEFIASFSYQKGVVNSALFCQEVMSYLLQQYSDRLSLFEHTQINKIVLKKDHALLDAFEHTIDTQKVILCTNGFESLTIINEGGLEIDAKFHHTVTGRVGYMSGYFEKMNKQPIAISYYSGNVPYYYLTRRPFEKDKNLISVGGPEIILEDRKDYIREYEYPDEAQEDIDRFIKGTYDTDPNKKIDFSFTWHGLMGYTPNRV